MKQLLTFLMLICSYALCGAQATSLTVDNQTPGWLSSKIAYSDQQTVENLTVKGFINGKDLQFITTLNTSHKLQGTVDLSNASIVDGVDGFTTKADILLTEWLSDWKPLKKFILPSTLKEFNTNSGYYREQYLFNIDTLIVNCPNMQYLNVIGEGVKHVHMSEGIHTLKVYMAKNVQSINFPSTLSRLTTYGGTVIGGPTGGHWDGKSELKIYSQVADPSNIEGIKVVKNATIYIPKGSYGEYKKICDESMTIIEDVYPSELIFGIKQKSIYVGDTYTIPYEILPSNSIHNEIVWSSSDENIATIDGGGLITAISFGKTDISATTINNLNQVVPIFVYEHVSNISLPSSISLRIGESQILDCLMYPLGKTLSELQWYSSNSEVATVSQDGKITGINKGTCDITVVASDGNHVASCRINIIQPVETINVSQKDISLRIGEKMMLSAIVSPSNANNKSIIWKSLNENIAIVSQNGEVTGKSGGNTIITVTSAENPQIKAECTVTVIQPTTGISLNKSTLELIEDVSEQLVATVLPENASDKSVKWTSSDISVAMVSSDGTVYAVKPGQATIMATTVDGGFVALCKVTVKAKTIIAERLQLSQETAMLAKSETLQLSATVLPENTTDKTLRWSSTNSSVATVSENGLVTGISEGSAQIIVTTTDGSNLSAICNVVIERQLTQISSLRINPSTSKLAIGANQHLIPVIEPSDASNKNLNWSSTDSTIATVSQDGVVLGVKEGKAVIIATTQDGSNLSATCEIEVFKNKILISSIELQPNKIEDESQTSHQIIATILPFDATNKDLSWSSSNNDVASVDSNGLVLLKAQGMAVISANATDGSDVKGECTIIVADATGIEDITIDKDTYVKIYDPEGSLVYEGEYSKANLTSGMYIIITKFGATKRIVK